MMWNVVFFLIKKGQNYSFCVHIQFLLGQIYETKNSPFIPFICSLTGRKNKDIKIYSNAECISWKIYKKANVNIVD